MALFQSNNPVLKQSVFDKAPHITGEAMTIRGTVNKMSFMLLLLMAAAVFPGVNFQEVALRCCRWQ